MPTRLTIVEHIYYEAEGEEPHQIGAPPHSRVLTREEQVYERRLTATEEWQSLDCGWLGDAVSMLHIVNTEGMRLQKNPTPEEQAAVASRVIEVSYTKDPGKAWLILPGESARGQPVEATSLFVRCRSGKAKFVLTLVPG